MKITTLKKSKGLSKTNNGVALYFRLMGMVILILCLQVNAGAYTIKPSADKKADFQTSVRGTVKDATGTALQGATVRVKGSNVTASTDASGTFVIPASSTSTLTVSYTGYKTMDVPVAGKTVLAVTLETDDNQLNEVVVTALGIAKERRSLGYSVTEVKGETLTQAREINVANSLVGKVAGLNVSSVSGGPGAAANIIIRGVSSISQSVQPLYVVNGVPMTNETTNGGGQFQDVADRGDNIQNINPDDIESISVLKGAAASALYGSRAKAGVILITTKSGKAGQPSSLEFNSNYVANQAIDVTDYQYEYGQGIISLAPGNASVVMTKPANVSEAISQSGSSWGPKIDGSTVIGLDGQTRTYSAAKNTIKNFYQIGQSLTNTLAFSKGYEGGGFRFSASDLENTNIVDYSTMARRTFNVSGNLAVIKRLTLDVRGNFILDKNINRDKLGDAPGNANATILRFANTIDLRDYENYILDANGAEYNLTGGQFNTNPFFALKYFRQNTNRDRLISSGRLRYDFDDGTFLQARVGRDSYTDRYTRIVPTGTAYQATGQLEEQSQRFWETNADFLAGRQFNVNKDISITPNVGASYRNVQTESFSASGTGFAIPYVYYLGNVPTRTVGYSLSNYEVQAVYGTLDISYKDLLYVQATGRTDWYSTLATSDGLNGISQFYPSVSSSFVFSQLLKGQKWMDFGKLRVGYAQVGQATSPYQTSLTYGANATLLNGLQFATVSPSTVPNKTLKPSLASEFEIGTEMRLFNNRVSLDIAYYDKSSKDEIVNAPASTTSGYSAAALNIGKISNRGVEGLITYTPIKNTNFSWTTSLNGSYNQNKIIALAPGDAPLLVATARSNQAFIKQVVGQPANQLQAYDYARDASGNIVYNATTGLPNVSTVLTNQGPAYAPWGGGWMNDFTFKRWNFGFMLDGKFGGKIYSGTEVTAFSNGKSKETLADRDKVFTPTISPRTATSWYSSISNVSQLFIYDSDYIKFRQATLGYTFPTNLFNGRVKNLSLSFVGRNLAILMRKTNNIDPESAYSGSTTGIEANSLPPIRSFGLNLSAKF